MGVQKAIFLEQLASCDVMGKCVLSSFGYFTGLKAKHSGDDLQVQHFLYPPEHDTLPVCSLEFGIYNL